MALLSLTDYVSAEMLQEIADKFYDATHMVVGFSDYQGNLLSRIDHFSTPICNYYRSAPQFENCCITCDAMAGMQASITRKPYTHICHSGLCYCALPIYLHSTYLGMALIGEVRVSEEEKKLLPSMQDMTHTQYPTPEFYQKAYEGIRLVTLDELGSHVKLLNILLQYIIEVGDKKINQDEFLKQQNDLLKKKEIEAELKVTTNKLKLQTLSNQMRPEFLQEAFDSIYQQAVIEGADETVKMLQALNVLLEREKGREENLITLEEELEYTKNLVHVIEFAQDRQIVFDVDLPSGAERILVPGRMISNIIEQYFLKEENNGDDVMIRVEVVNEDAYLNIQLYSPQIPLPSLSISGNEKAGHPKRDAGDVSMMCKILLNLMKLIYGENFSIRVSSEGSGQDRMCIRIPQTI